MADKKPKLHELLATEADLMNTANAMVEDCKVTFTKKTDHFQGLLTTTTFFDTSRQAENTTEEKLLVSTVSERIDYAVKYVARYWDALLQKEASNQHAKADLIVDGVTLASEVPATWLLGMETRLRAFRDLLLSIPTLSPGVDWQEDPTADKPGVFKSKSPSTFKTEKTAQSKVLYDATDKHPAQIEKWYEDKPIARIERLVSSGMWTPLHKATVIGKLDNLLLAVKKARQRANDVDVVQKNVASSMLDYIFKV